MVTQVRFQFGLGCQTVPGGGSLMERRWWEQSRPPQPSILAGMGAEIPAAIVFPLHLLFS